MFWLIYCGPFCSITTRNWQNNFRFVITIKNLQNNFRFVIVAGDLDDRCKVLKIIREPPWRSRSIPYGSMSEARMLAVHDQAGRRDIATNEHDPFRDHT